MKSGSLIAHLSAAGLFLGVVAWTFQQEAGYILAAYACGKAIAWFWLVSGVAVLILVAGALLSAARRAGREPPASQDGRPRQFMAWIGVTAAAIFAFAILMQAAAALILPSCRP